MKKRAQTATEYLIILAVVIIIALIVVGVIGGMPGVGKKAGSRSSATYWATLDVAITDHAVSASSDQDMIIIKNNHRNPIKVHDMTVNGVDLESSMTTLGVGQSHTYRGAIDACTAGKDYSYSISITYEDTKSGFNTTFTGDGNNLDGTCAS